jgi:hypothetical protein
MSVVRALLKIAKSIWDYKDATSLRAFSTFTAYLCEAVKRISIECGAKTVGLIAAPRSSEEKPNNIAKSIQRIVEILNKEQSNTITYFNMAGALKRTTAVEASHTSSKRKSLAEHMQTITCRGIEDLKTDLIIILDDITTRGDTLCACRQLAKMVMPLADVKLLAIAKTSAAYCDNNEIIQWQEPDYALMDDPDDEIEI